MPPVDLRAAFETVQKMATQIAEQNIAINGLVSQVVDMVESNTKTLGKISGAMEKLAASLSAQDLTKLEAAQREAGAAHARSIERLAAALERQARPRAATFAPEFDENGDLMQIRAQVSDS